MHVFKIVQ